MKKKDCERQKSKVRVHIMDFWVKLRFIVIFHTVHVREKTMLVSRKTWNSFLAEYFHKECCRLITNNVFAGLRTTFAASQLHDHEAPVFAGPLVHVVLHFATGSLVVVIEHFAAGHLFTKQSFFAASLLVNVHVVCIFCCRPTCSWRTLFRRRFDGDFT